MYEGFHGASLEEERLSAGSDGDEQIRVLFSLYDGNRFCPLPLGHIPPLSLLWGLLWCLRHQKNLSAVGETQVWSPGQENLLEKGMQPTPIFLPRKPQGWKNLEGYGPWCHVELDRTEQLTHIPLPSYWVTVWWPEASWRHEAVFSPGPEHHQASTKSEMAQPFAGLPFYLEMKAEALLWLCLLFPLGTPLMLWEDRWPSQRRKETNSCIRLGQVSAEGALPCSPPPHVHLAPTLCDWGFSQGNCWIFRHFRLARVEGQRRSQDSGNKHSRWCKICKFWEAWEGVGWPIYIYIYIYIYIIFFNISV